MRSDTNRNAEGLAIGVTTEAAGFARWTWISVSNFAQKGRLCLVWEERSRHDGFHHSLDRLVPNGIHQGAHVGDAELLRVEVVVG